MRTFPWWQRTAAFLPFGTAMACQNCLIHTSVPIPSHFGSRIGFVDSLLVPQSTQPQNPTPRSAMDLNLRISALKSGDCYRDITKNRLVFPGQMRTNLEERSVENDLQKMTLENVTAAATAAIFIAATAHHEIVLALAMLSVMAISHMTQRNFVSEKSMRDSKVYTIDSSDNTEELSSKEEKKKTLEEVLGLDEESESDKESDSSPEKTVSSAMIATIGVYKNFISPLLPPACRFAPTCSQYGVQAIKEFGSVKGIVLIAWRLLRCSPIGGKGYDPPKWPPVHFTYSSY